MQRSKRLRRLRVTAASVLILIICISVLLFILTPSVDNLEGYRPKAEFVYNSPLGSEVTLNATNSSYIPLNDLPDFLVKGIVAVEDRRFYYHPGIDPIAIARAGVQAVRNPERIQGASTITQQLARSAYLSQERTLSRKMEEMILALKIEYAYPKEKILEFYFNDVFFGDQIYMDASYDLTVYGVQDASRFYFRKNASDLSISEAAFLTAILKGPNYYLTRPEELEKRRQVVLEIWSREHIISEEEYLIALREPTQIVQSKAAS